MTEPIHIIIPILTLFVGAALGTALGYSRGYVAGVIRRRVA
jgi:hypothetical protein